MRGSNTRGFRLFAEMDLAFGAMALAIRPMRDDLRIPVADEAPVEVELFGVLRGDVFRQGQRHAVSGYHGRVRDIGDAHREITDQPVQVLTVYITQRSVPSPARGV